MTVGSLTVIVTQNLKRPLTYTHSLRTHECMTNSPNTRASSLAQTDNADIIASDIFSLERRMDDLVTKVSNALAE